MSLENTTALVTGGASGMGEASARRLAEAGATVVVVDRDATKGEKVAAVLGGRFVQADITDEGQVTAAVEAATEVAPLRTCIHCAGCTMTCTILEISPSGAKLRPQDPIWVPESFDLKLPDGSRRHCDLVRRVKTDIAVRYAD
jgi:NAD(P)-dependent dehydrogenase (short-subunit alcohol dehydrogenase family)